jgi:murein L,D-transpeptidase YcbB/YkuD
LILGPVFAGLVAAQPNARLQAKVEQIRTEGTLVIDGAQIAAADLVADFYEDRGFIPAWQDPARIEGLLRLVDAMAQYGLDPDDYHRRELRAMDAADRQGRLGSDGRIDRDLLLTDSVVRVAYHALFGKVDPTTLDPHWNFNRRPYGGDRVRDLEAAVRADSLEDLMADLIPEPYFHRRLRRGLARYRAIAEAGGWPALPEGPSLKPGIRDPRVPVLRERLRITGDYPDQAPPEVPGEAMSPELYDGRLVAAVEVFQARHGLDMDGVVGPATRAALNVPVTVRIDQIRVNLERMRWVYRDLPPDFVLVDIAGFHVHLIRGGKPIWSARVQVGRPYRKTPVFRDEITYLEFNPTWTVPPGILRKDILPKVKQDPDYLRQRNIRIIDRDGRRVDPGEVDWSAVSASSFPYTLRQDPGPDNALGRVKFMFPNPYLVYLHDTPSQDLFDRAQRLFSSGCIRVERPFELAELVLANPERWNQATFRALVESGQTRTIRLTEPLPVILFYWTAEAREDGTVMFREDVYGRDAAVLEALEGHFTFRPPANPQGPVADPGWSD